MFIVFDINCCPICLFYDGYLKILGFLIDPFYRTTCKKNDTFLKKVFFSSLLRIMSEHSILFLAQQAEITLETLIDQGDFNSFAAESLIAVLFAIRR